MEISANGPLWKKPPSHAHGASIGDYTFSVISKRLSSHAGKNIDPVAFTYILGRR